jgi:hypothetical protein
MTDFNPQATIDALLARLTQMKDGVPEEVLKVFEEAEPDRLDPEELEALLERALTTFETLARRRGDDALADHYADREAAMTAIREARRQLSDNGRRRVELQSHYGQEPQVLIPAPILNGREFRIKVGYLPVREIQLWDENSRLQVHIEQFEESRERRPTGDELLEIMFTRMDLPGVEGIKDEFRIKELARSIARNKVRQPPIIDSYGRLLDGNRRVAACHYILQAEPEEFGTEAKLNAEWVPVWQLDEYATPDEIRHLLIAMNFEPVMRVQWPKYVRANQVVDEYRRRARVEQTMDKRRDTQIRREVATYFDIKTNEVTSYIKMIELAEQFESHHIEHRDRDAHEVKHKSSRHFEYFDEMAKGEASGVNYVLRQNDDLRRLVFDLLYEDKFTRFSQVRHIKHLPESNDAVTQLQTARDLKAATDEQLDDATEKVDDALTAAAAAAKERRALDPNTKIENFVDWLRALPIDTLVTKVEEENLRALQEALTIANTLVKHALTQPQR